MRPRRRRGRSRAAPCHAIERLRAACHYPESRGCSPFGFEHGLYRSNWQIGRLWSFWREHQNASKPCTVRSRDGDGLIQMLHCVTTVSAPPATKACWTADLSGPSGPTSTNRPAGGTTHNRGGSLGFHVWV